MRICGWILFLCSVLWYLVVGVTLFGVTIFLSLHHSLYKIAIFFFVIFLIYTIVTFGYLKMFYESLKD